MAKNFDAALGKMIAHINEQVSAYHLERRKIMRSSQYRNMRFHVAGPFKGAQVHENRGKKKINIVLVGKTSKVSGVNWGYVDEKGNIREAKGPNGVGTQIRGSIYKPSSWKKFSWFGPQDVFITYT